jgi:hypothetical protein
MLNVLFFLTSTAFLSTCSLLNVGCMLCMLIWRKHESSKCCVHVIWSSDHKILVKLRYFYYLMLIFFVQLLQCVFREFCAVEIISCQHSICFWRYKICSSGCCFDSFCWISCWVNKTFNNYLEQ